MRVYGHVDTFFWLDGRVRELSDTSKILALYLLTCGRGNILGCYHIPYKIMIDDLGWSVDTIKKNIMQLMSIDFMTYDHRTGFVFIHDFTKWNPAIRQLNQKSLQKLLRKIPKKISFYPKVIEMISREQSNLMELHS